MINETVIIVLKIAVIILLVSCIAIQFRHAIKEANKNEEILETKRELLNDESKKSSMKYFTIHAISMIINLLSLLAAVILGAISFSHIQKLGLDNSVIFQIASGRAVIILLIVSIIGGAIAAISAVKEERIVNNKNNWKI